MSHFQVENKQDLCPSLNQIGFQTRCWCFFFLFKFCFQAAQIERELFSSMQLWEAMFNYIFWLVKCIRGRQILSCSTQCARSRWRMWKVHDPKMYLKHGHPWRDLPCPRWVGLGMIHCNQFPGTHHQCKPVNAAQISSARAACIQVLNTVITVVLGIEYNTNNVLLDVLNLVLSKSCTKKKKNK